MERRPLPQPARHAVEPLNEHGTGLYSADQAAVVVTALVSQIYTAAAELAGLAEHLLALQEHRYAETSHKHEEPDSPHRSREGARRETLGRWTHWNTDFAQETLHGFGVAVFDVGKLRRTATADRIDQLWVSAPLRDTIVDYALLGTPAGTSDHHGLVVRIDLDRARTDNMWEYK